MTLSPHYLNSITDFLLINFTLFGSLLYIILAAGQVTVLSKKNRNYLIAGVFFSTGLVNGFAYLLESGLYLSIHPLFMLPAYIMLFTTGPLVYLLFRDFLQEDSTFKKNYYHFIFPLFLLIASYTYFAFYPAEMSNITHDLFKKEFGPVKTLFLSGLAGSGLYSLKIVKDAGFLWRSSDLMSQSFSTIIIINMIIFPFLGLLFAVLFILTAEIFYLEISSATITMTQVIGYISGNRHPENFHDLEEFILEIKPRRSMLGNIDLDQVENRLQKMLAEEEIFRNENLNLRDLATELEITPHQLSEFCNVRMDKTFTTLINEYRINDARSQLESDPEKSIISIAYEAGFGSPAAFYRAFDKFTGISPKEYRLKKSKNQ